MATVYRETFTKPMPAGAELFIRNGERFARWVDKRGRKRTARVVTPADGAHAGTDRLLIEAATYTAKYRNGEGVIVKVSTGCQTLDAARAVLADLEKRADAVRSGLCTAEDDAARDHARTPIDRHVDAYLEHLKAKRVRGRIVSTAHAVNVEHVLRRIIRECEFGKLLDIRRPRVDRWVRETEANNKLAARTINAHLAALIAFANWAVTGGKLASNPLYRFSKLDERSAPKRQRRALTEAELERLLTVARLRPIAEHGRETVPVKASERPTDRRSRKTWKRAELSSETFAAAELRGRAALSKQPEFLARLERTGLERALLYKVLVLTGLRKGELAALKVSAAHLDGPSPALVLGADDDKAGRGADIPLRADVAADLRSFLADRLATTQQAARAAGKPIPARLPGDAPLLHVPNDLIRVLDRDLTAAGIEKRDDRGRTLDVHALRHTFATHLSMKGVAPRIAQAALRHSKLDLTMNTYTDPRLLDVAGALERLPALPLDPRPDRNSARATGTHGAASHPDAAASLVPMLVPNSGQAGVSGSIGDPRAATLSIQTAFASSASDTTKERLSSGGEKRATGVEPATFSLEG